MFGLTNAWTRDSYFLITAVSKNRVSQLTIKNWHLVFVCIFSQTVGQERGKGRQARGQPEDIWARLGERENGGDKHLLIERKTHECFCSFFGALIWNTRLFSSFELSVFFGINILTKVCEWNLQVKRCRNSDFFLQVFKSILDCSSCIWAATVNNRNAVPRDLSSGCVSDLRLPPKRR